MGILHVMDVGKSPSGETSSSRILNKTYKNYIESPSKSRDGSYLIQETNESIKIADPRNKATITLYKFAVSKDLKRSLQRAKRSDGKPRPITVAHIINHTEKERVTKAVEKAIGNPSITRYPYAQRVIDWFKKPKKTLTMHELNYWNDQFKDTPEYLIHDEYANKMFKKRYKFKYNANTLNDKNRKLNDIEKASIISHTFAREVDRYIQKYGIYTKYALETLPADYKDTFYIPGVIITDNTNLNNYLKRLVFGYTIGTDGTFFHRFASDYIKKPKIVDGIMSQIPKAQPSATHAQ